MSEILGIAPFQPEEHQQAPLLDKSPVVLLWGPSGGGKSRIAAEKLAAFALHYPGATVVASRKKFDDMLQSTIPLFCDTVLDVKHNPRATYRARESRIVIDHGADKESSEIVFTGIYDEKAREGIKSIGKKGSVDMWWMEEGTEYEEEDFNYVNTRVRGVAAPWGQVIVTTNPGGSLHWINRRLLLGGEASNYYSDATMNRYNSADYISRLKKLTGVERARLYEGRWVDGSGAVISSWVDHYNEKTGDAPGNVTPEADYIPGAGPVVWAVDDGYSGERDRNTGLFTDKSQPRAFLLAQKRSNGLLAIFHEEYDVQVLQGDHIKRVLDLSESWGYPRPDYVVHDVSAPSLAGSLLKAKLKPVSARVKIDDGVKELREWCGEDRNGLRRLIVHPRCSYLRLEMGSYSFDKRGVPIDAFNHGIDAIRYLTWHEAYGPSTDASVAAPPGVDTAAIEMAIAAAMARIEEKMKHAFA